MSVTGVEGCVHAGQCVGLCGRVVTGFVMTEVLVAVEAAVAEVLATAAEVVAVSAKSRLWQRQPIACKYKYE